MICAKLYNSKSFLINLFKAQTKTQTTPIQMDEDIRIRAKEALTWLKEQRVIISQKDAAIKMGYNPCVMSTRLNRTDKLSNRFIEKLCSLSPRIRIDWLRTGKGDMLAEEVFEDELPLEQHEQLDMHTLVRIIDGQVKTIGFMTNYLDKIETEHKLLMKEISTLRSEVSELREKLMQGI